MSTLDLARANLTSPAVLAFAVGLIATLARSDLRFPEPVYVLLSTYLLFALGPRFIHLSRCALLLYAIVSRQPPFDIDP